MKVEIKADSSSSYLDKMLKEKQAAEESPSSTTAECAGCVSKIQDRFYLEAADRQWHANCLRCCECQLSLDSELTCFYRDGNIYCKDDYYRLFALKRCARCGHGITPNELVMRARDLVYHLTCFVCVACSTPLSKGDVFGMRDGLIYCRPHYDTACLGEYCDDELHTIYRCQEINGSPSPFNRGPAQKGRPRKRKLNQNAIDDLQVHTMRLAGSALEIIHRNELSSSMESLSYDSSVASPGSVNSHHSQRTKRMRTSFKHHQLRTMKSYFAINQNPDAKDLKQLAQKTGLSKRVLQVWFQNARAKWRRNIMRQESGPGSVGMNGSLIGGGGTGGSGTSAGLLGDSMQTAMEEIQLQPNTPHSAHPLAYSELY